MTGEPGWASFLEEHFPGYLLPSSARQVLSEEAATRFLERITGRPDQLTLLRAVSTLSPRIAMLRDFALRELPELVRRLPARTESVRRDWEGGFQGRLDVRATLPFHLAGQRTHFVTRARTRRFDMPENVLVRAVAVRLLGLLERLRRASATASVGWGAELSTCEASLRHTLSATVLREVPDDVVTPFHEQAATMGRAPCYALALAWHRALRDGMDSRDEQTIAQVVAQGALAPLDMPTRFELAVVVRLVHALWTRLDVSEPGRWRAAPRPRPVVGAVGRGLDRAERGRELLRVDGLAHGRRPPDCAGIPHGLVGVQGRGVGFAHAGIVDRGAARGRWLRCAFTDGAGGRGAGGLVGSCGRFVAGGGQRTGVERASRGGIGRVGRGGARKGAGGVPSGDRRAVRREDG